MDQCAPASFETFAVAISQANDPVQIAKALFTLVRRFGFEAIAITESLPLSCDYPPHDYLAEYWPDDWPIDLARRLLAPYQNYRWVDFLSGSLSFHTSASRRSEQISPPGRFKSEAVTFEDLMFVPVPQSDGRLGMVTYIGRRQDPADTFTTLLEAGAIAAYKRCRTLYDFPKSNLLTRQQRTICSWLALGKTSAEIGEILGIAEATVDQHVRQCKERLGTSNRTATVIEAIRRGQLLPVSCASR